MDYLRNNKSLMTASTLQEKFERNVAEGMVLRGKGRGMGLLVDGSEPS